VGKLKPGNTLTIGDTHFPFVKRHYLDFCKEIQQRCKCENVVHIGDLVDNHSLSYHEHDPNGKGPKDEIDKAIRIAKRWYKAFPNVSLTRGNHDSLVDRKGKTVGLPQRVFRPFRDIWELPKGWRDAFEFEIHGVKYVHGTGYSGVSGHINAAKDAMRSTVVGHMHAFAGVNYIKTGKKTVFGLNVGCGIDVTSYAMTYGKPFRHKPIIGCGVITDYGLFAQFFPML